MVKWLRLRTGNLHNPNFKSLSDYELDLYYVFSRSISRLHLNITNWPPSCQLGFLTHGCQSHLLVSSFLCQLITSRMAKEKNIHHYFFFLVEHWKSLKISAPNVISARLSSVPAQRPNTISLKCICVIMVILRADLKQE